MKQEKEESKRGKQKFSRRDIPGWSSIQFPAASLAELNYYTSHFMCHFVQKFTKVAGYVFRKCVSVRLFIVSRVYIYIAFRLQNMNNFILRFQFLFRLFTTYLNEIQTKSVIIRLKLCANGHRTPSNVESCCVRLHVAKRFTCFKLCATTSNNTTQQRATSCNRVYLEGVQTDATCNIQRC